MPKPDLLKCFHSSREIIRLAVRPYILSLLSLRNVEDLRHEHGIDISHETVRFWNAPGHVDHELVWISMQN